MAAKKKAVAKKPHGRPTALTEKKMEKIFDWICDGVTLKDVAKKLKVARFTVYRWMDKFPEFKEMIEKAREIQAQVYMDDLISIADDESRDILIGPDGTSKPNAAAVARDKLKLATRQKIAGYYAPRIFGENATKIDITTNGDAVFMGLMITPPKPYDDDEEVIDVDQE